MKHPFKSLRYIVLAFCPLFSIACSAIGDVATRSHVSAPTTSILWLNHLALLPGDSSVHTSFNYVNSEVGGGLSGLVVQSTTTGEIAQPGGNKAVWMAVQVPPGFDIVGVRVGYELTSSSSFISQIRLAQVQNPPDKALIILDDGTDHTSTGPIYIDSTPTLIHPEQGPVLLSLRVNFGSTSDKIAIRALGLIVKAKAD